MLSIEETNPELALDPAPCTSSDEDIRKAEAIREALRRKLLNRNPRHDGKYWVVGVD